MKRISLVFSYFYMVLLLISIPFMGRIKQKKADFVKQNGLTEITWNSQLQNHVLRKRASLGQDQFKFDNPNKFVDYHLGIRTRVSEDKPGYLAGNLYNELLDAKKNKFYRSASAARISDLEWTERGPSNVPGRTRAILILPEGNENNSWLAGGVGGGIWKTSTGGENWDLKTPDIPSLAISWLTLCESQPNVIYASTGEAIGGGRGIIGNGILKSTDWGENWEVIPSTLDKEEFSVISRIIVDHVDPNVVVICSARGPWNKEFQSGIYKSIDGGISWKEAYNTDKWISQVISDPTDFNIQYAAKFGGGVLKSTDGGDSWFDSSFGMMKINGRLEIANAPTDPSRLFAATQGDISGSGSDLYVSFDAGANWSVVDQKYDNQSVDYFRGQGDYDNTIAVNPFDEDEVYFGGVNLWRTRINEVEQDTDLPDISVTVANDSLSYWDFVNFGAEYFDGRLEIGAGFSNSKFVDVEVRTGSGETQYAHRFTVNKQGSGVPDSQYKYVDYVEVPFEVWDINNNRQLMVSFRDQQEDGEFNLIHENTAAGDEANHSREYIYIHAIEYSETPNERIAQNEGKRTGHTHEQMYFYWPVLREEFEWNPAALIPDTILIDFETISLVSRFGELTPVSDAYGDFVENLNSAYDQATTEFSFHPDHHNLIMIPVDSVDKTFMILNANDGGVFVSNISANPGINDGDWTSKGEGYITGQFYSAAKKPGAEVYIGGLQDNGTWKSPDGVDASTATSYVSVWGGDGFDVLWNYLDTDKYMISVYNNLFYRTEDNGKTWFESGQDISGIKPFFSKLASSNSTPDVIYTVSSEGVYKSSDFGKQWLATEISDNWGFSDFIDIKVSLANQNIVWAGSGMADDLSLHVSTDGGTTFTKTNNFTNAELGFISGIATHPEEDSTAYGLFSFSKGPKILKTENLGQTWEDISGFLSSQTSNNGFPDVAVYCLLVRPDNVEIIWAGTEIGIFESMDDGNTWSYLENEMGAAAVWDMNVMDDEIVIATHGRGIFTAKLPEAVEVIPSPVVNGYGININGNLAIDLNLLSAYDSTIIDINGTINILDAHPVGLTKLEISDLPSNDSLGISIVSYLKGKSYSANPFGIINYEVDEPVREYVENFNAGSDDFIGDFSITEIDGFEDNAIHSLHPYEEGTNFQGHFIDYVYQLRTPIIVASNDAIMRYDAIAIVEPAESGATYPSEEFYDYVVLEGSKDGVNWMPLAPGYDAKMNSKWLNVYQNDVDVDKSIFVEQTIDLLNTYEANDTIFIRFRLHSDPLEAGWGWVIDNISIQDKITGLSTGNFSDAIRIYPNPASDFVEIELTKGHAYSELIVYNLNGSLVKNFTIDQNPSEKIAVDISDLKNGIYLIKLVGIHSERVSKLMIK